MDENEVQRILMSETAQKLLADIAQTHQALDVVDRRIGLPVSYDAPLPRRALALQSAIAGSVVVSRATAVAALGGSFLLGIGVGLWLARRAARQRVADPYQAIPTW